MATDADDPKASSRDDASDSGASDNNDSDSELSNPDSDSESPAQKQPVEWLATSRAKRSTAGNRMKAMLAQEGVSTAAEDDDLELLFAEDGDDAGFSEDENGRDDASDVQMDSSSDEEDQDNDADDLEGEKELERQAREERKKRTAKRKAQDAILPAKFRKKRVRIEDQPSTTRGTTATGSASPAPTSAGRGPRIRPPPAPRPKKKSERTSWLPTAADMPTRASERHTTKVSKVQLNERLLKDDIRRKMQAEMMERKAKKLAAMKKPPMTQAERLAEAALVEKRNSKSLNRWEEAEKQREEERMRKIAALHDRKLDGPVVSFWSGALDLEGEQIQKHAGLLVAMEEKAPRKKRQSAAALLAAQEEAEAAKNASLSNPPLTTGEPETETGGKAPSTAANVLNTESNTPSAGQSGVDSPAMAPNPAAAPVSAQASTQEPSQATATAPVPPPQQPQQPQPSLVPQQSQQPSLVPQQASPAMPMGPPPASAAPIAPSSSGVLAAPVLAPPMMGPPGMLGGQMPVLGFPAGANTTSSVLAPPNTSHTPSPLSLPPSTPSAPAPILDMTAPQVAPVTASPAATGAFQQPVPAAVLQPTQPKTKKAQQAQKAATETLPLPQAEPEPPMGGKVARFCILLQDFDDEAIKDKQVVTKILFGKKMVKLAKPPHAPTCAITGQLAKYRDPKTGLPYANSHAYKEIQRILKGEYKYSSLIDGWVGTGTQAATGVPERFLDPSKPRSTPLSVEKPKVEVKAEAPSEKTPATGPPAGPGEVAVQNLDPPGPAVSTGSDHIPGPVLQEAGQVPVAEGPANSGVLAS